MSSNKKTIVNPVLATRIASIGIGASAFSCLDYLFESFCFCVNLESKKKKICFLSFVSFLFIGFRFVNFCLGFITFVSCLCSCSCASEPSLGVRVSSHKFGALFTASRFLFVFEFVSTLSFLPLLSLQIRPL